MLKLQVERPMMATSKRLAKSRNLDTPRWLVLSLIQFDPRLPKDAAVGFVGHWPNITPKDCRTFFACLSQSGSFCNRIGRVFSWGNWLFWQINGRFHNLDGRSQESCRHQHQVPILRFDHSGPLPKLKSKAVLHPFLASLNLRCK